MRNRWWVGAALAVALRPGLWRVALVQALRLARPRWWRRRPFLPLPDPDYLRFRLQTAYGSEAEPGAREVARDVVVYLRWCRHFPGG